MKLTLEVNVRNLILTASCIHGLTFSTTHLTAYRFRKTCSAPDLETKRRLHCVGRLAEKGKIDLRHVETMERAVKWIFEEKEKHEKEKA